MKPNTKNFGLFWFVSVFQTYIETTKTNRTVSKQNLSNPKFSENMLSIKLLQLVLCLFWFKRNIESHSFGIEAKQPKQTVLKQTETIWNNPKFSETKFKICSISYCFLIALLFVSVQSKHRNSLFRYRSEKTKTNILFQIVPKLVFGCFESKVVLKDTLEAVIGGRGQAKGEVIAKECTRLRHFYKN